MKQKLFAVITFISLMCFICSTSYAESSLDISSVDTTALETTQDENTQMNSQPDVTADNEANTTVAQNEDSFTDTTEGNRPVDQSTFDKSSDVYIENNTESTDSNLNSEIRDNPKSETESNNVPLSTVVAILALFLSTINFILSLEIQKRTQWSEGMNFFTRFDSFEVRQSRKRVYNARDKHDGKIDDATLKIKYDEKDDNSLTVEDDICYNISLYDSTILMISQNLLPEDLIQGARFMDGSQIFRNGGTLYQKTQERYPIVRRLLC